MNFTVEEAKRRLFSPRIVIYLILAVAAAWLMHRMDGYSRQETPVEIARESGKEKQRLPMMIFFVEGEGSREEQKTIEDACQALAEKCTVMKMAETPENLKAVFNVKQIPSVILFDAGNKEIKRVEGSLKWEELKVGIP